MATKEKKGGADGAKGGAKGKKKGGDAPKARGPHAGADKPVPPPRLREFYQGTVRGSLMEQFGLKTPHQDQTLPTHVPNVGPGEAINQPKFLDSIVEELAIITGQQP